MLQTREEIRRRLEEQKLAKKRQEAQERLEREQRVRGCFIVFLFPLASLYWAWNKSAMCFFNMFESSLCQVLFGTGLVDGNNS